jgi:hypothetical protein
VLVEDGFVEVGVGCTHHFVDTSMKLLEGAIVQLTSLHELDAELSGRSWAVNYLLHRLQKRLRQAALPALHQELQQPHICVPA